MKENSLVYLFVSLIYSLISLLGFLFSLLICVQPRRECSCISIEYRETETEKMATACEQTSVTPVKRLWHVCEAL